MINYRKLSLFIVKSITLVFLILMAANIETEAQSTCVPSSLMLSDTGEPSCYSTGSITRFERNQRWRVTYPGDSIGIEIGTGDIGQCILNTSGYL
jgi:hypothetical protein